jgi:hypothetical protein
VTCEFFLEAGLAYPKQNVTIIVEVEALMTGQYSHQFKLRPKTITEELDNCDGSQEIYDQSAQNNVQGYLYIRQVPDVVVNTTVRPNITEYSSSDWESSQSSSDQAQSSSDEEAQTSSDQVESSTNIVDTTQSQSQDDQTSQTKSETLDSSFTINNNETISTQDSSGNSSSSIENSEATQSEDITSTVDQTFIEDDDDVSGKERLSSGYALFCVIPSVLALQILA